MRKPMNLLDESIRPEKIIFYLAWPTILEQLLLTLVQYVDTAMVGSLGVQATASIAITTSFSWLINGIFAAIAVGFSVPVGRCIGAKDYEGAKKIMQQSLIAILTIGSVLTGVVLVLAPYLPKWLGADPSIVPNAGGYLSIIALSYVFNLAVNICSSIIRCSGDTKTPLIFNIATNLINVVLNFLLIFPTRSVSILGTSFTMWGAGLGVHGAAIATSLSIAFSGVMLTLVFFRKTSFISLHIKEKFTFERSIWSEMIRLGSPVAAERITLSLGQIIMTTIASGIGTIALASHHLAITAEAITYMPAFGFSIAATTLVSQSLGAGKPQLAKKFSGICIVGGIILMTVMGAVLFTCSELLVSIFTPDMEVVKLGGSVLRIEAFAQPFFAISMVVSGVLRGSSDTKWPFFISIIGMWLVRLPLAFVLANYTSLGLMGVWVGMVMDICCRGIISLYRYKTKNFEALS